MNRLLESIQPYLTINTEELSYLEEAIERRVYQKGEVIFSEGKVSHDIYFVDEGCVRLYYTVDGIEKTAFFYTEGQFICAGESYTYQVPAVESYQAVEKTEIYVFSRPRIERLLETVPEFEVIARVATENELITCQKMIASFVTKSAEQRYTDLLNTQRELFQRVPQQYIASFLGISPETLSRIKLRVLRKERS